VTALDLLAIVTTSWGVVMALAPVLQIRVIVRERDAGGTSLGWVLILLVGFVLWLSYGLVNRTWPIIITNVVALTTGIALLVTTRLYARREASQDPSGSSRGV
jgi:MtN3 and saliva related transmembrane protein